MCVSTMSSVEPREMAKGDIKWIMTVIPDALKNLAVVTNSNAECNKHGELYKNCLSNNSFWAVKMYDSTASSPTGFLTSSSYNFGAYDQCLSIEVPSYNLNGQYCLVSLSFQPDALVYPEYHKIRNDAVYTDVGAFESAWLKLKRSKDPRIKYRDTIHLAVCVPSSCSPQDVQLALQKLLNPILKQGGIAGNITVDPKYCQTLEERLKLDIHGSIFLLILATLTTLVVTATLVHIFVFNDEQLSKLSNWFFKFSLVTNLKKLTKSEGPKELQFLSGMKVWSMIIIIYGHRLLSNLYKNVLNPEDQEKKYGQFLQTVNFNGAIVVNTFLLISGFLSYHKYLLQVEDKRRINPFLFILFRWLRVTPVYMVVIGFCALILPISEGGPFWKSEGLTRYSNCRRNWWTYILFINNYYKTEEECLIPSWYLAVDMQLFVICTVVGYVTLKNRKIVSAIISILLLASIALPAYVFYQGKYNAVIKFYLNYLPNYFHEEDYINTYTRTHMRASPYFAGMATALLYIHLQKNNFKFNKWQMGTGTVLAVLFTIGTLLSAWIFFIPGHETSLILNVLYGSLNRLLWALALAWVILAESTTGFGMVSHILNQNVYAPLSKLTLSVLIVHTPLQQYLLLQQRLPNHLDLTMTIWMTCGDVLISYTLALILYLIVEAPLSNLQVLLLKKLLSNK
ncbi:nose resistant to fluoxetine protein 6-like isoform X2 [Cimex lectularius]|nr:nose resistant to fluoxetine protein 6-like isoform X2 [Cimex lectularius]XP_024084910.1 nose resistant to fluoxetine protein 6-like isoform X2 [Cimex lectularius]XP_024084911.1 nose resistant to fluoxetine protein 6-like isoform X2 [Cimex lectularius]XP_024084912.1 nose resistant to fluoxetine protein 6-like isoform X2 [Cimex lectularius]XP_024084913.1 nose resistant to fluoxetine protein 6-like isoform X2 [Cimex lectularius]